MTLVSVIITTYHGVKTLKRAIKSVQNQTYTDWELIVVDDNEPESETRKQTEQLIESIMEPKLRYIKMDKHRNGACARNVGVASAKGKYVALLDDDDIYYPNRLECCVCVLEEKREYDGVLTGGYHVDENVVVGKFCGIRPKEPLKRMFYGFGILGTGSNIFVSKHSWDALNGFDETFAIRQDLEFMIRFMSQFDCFFLDEELVLKIGTSRKGKVTNYKKIREGDIHFYETFKEQMNDLFDDKEKYEIYNEKFSWLFRVGLTSSEKDVVQAVQDLQRIRKMTIKEQLMFRFNKPYRGLKNISFINNLKIKIQNRKKFYIDTSMVNKDFFNQYNIKYYTRD